MVNWKQTPQLPKAEGRIEAIDLARGIAIGLMIVSHTVSGLIGIRNVPDWGMVPVHFLTKFSSSLFIVVFGVALAVAFLAHTQTDDWPRRRLKLWLRALEVWFWYKALTIVEMLPFNAPADIVDTLLYGRFAIWVEILGFYAIALLWVPLMLPLWARAPRAHSGHSRAYAALCLATGRKLWWQRYSQSAAGRPPGPLRLGAA